MVVAWTCELGVTLVPLSIESWSDVMFISQQVYTLWAGSFEVICNKFNIDKTQVHLRKKIIIAVIKVTTQSAVACSISSDYCDLIV